MIIFPTRGGHRLNPLVLERKGSLGDVFDGCTRALEDKPKALGDYAMIKTQEEVLEHCRREQRTRFG